MKSKETGRKKFAVGLMQLLWAELKTMNLVKIKSLYKVFVGYVMMKYFKSRTLRRKKALNVAERRALRQEVSYRISR